MLSWRVQWEALAASLVLLAEVLVNKYATGVEIWTGDPEQGMEMVETVLS